MAKSKQEYETIINTEALTHPELDDLQSDESLFQFWNFVKKVMAFLSFKMDTEFDQFKEEVNTVISSTEIGTEDWWINAFYEFQFGDNLAIQNNVPAYSVIDETKRIIKRVSIKQDSNAILQIRLVKETNGVYAKLDLTELAASIAYATRIKIAGTRLDIQSLDADQFYLESTITLDPIAFDDNGININSGLPTVKDTIETFLKEFDFGGMLYVSRLIDKVMDIPGVIDFNPTIKNLNTVNFSHKVSSNAGWIELDGTSIFNYVLL